MGTLLKTVLAMGGGILSLIRQIGRQALLILVKLGKEPEKTLHHMESQIERSYKQGQIDDERLRKAREIFKRAREHSTGEWGKQWIQAFKEIFVVMCANNKPDAKTTTEAVAKTNETITKAVSDGSVANMSASDEDMVAEISKSLINRLAMIEDRPELGFYRILTFRGTPIDPEVKLEPYEGKPTVKPRSIFPNWPWTALRGLPRLQILERGAEEDITDPDFTFPDDTEEDFGTI